jgi:hypothetical protein
MNEEINKSGDNGKEQLELKEQKDLTLVITLHRDSGQLTVQGPGNGQMFDEPMCFWMLHKAEKFIETVNAKINQSPIIQPKPRIKDIFFRRK